MVSKMETTLDTEGHIRSAQLGDRLYFKKGTPTEDDGGVEQERYEMFAADLRVERADIDASTAVGTMHDSTVWTWQGSPGQHFATLLECAENAFRRLNGGSVVLHAVGL